MRNKFFLSTLLNNATDTSGGSWTSAELDLSVADAEGVYTGLDVAVGDVVFVDTSPYEVATVSKYTVTGIVSSSIPSVIVSVAYDAENDHLPPDIGFCVGTAGFLSRTTATSKLILFPPPALYTVPEKMVYYASNYNLNDVLDNGTGGSVPTYSITNAYASGDKAMVGAVALVANAAIPAGTSFAFGTTGATWSLPVNTVAGESWHGVYDPIITYAIKSVVVDANGSAFIAVNVSTGASLDDLTYWEPYAPLSNLTGLLLGATDLLPGKAGLVPAPAAGDEEKFLRGDGTWAEVPAGMSFWDLTSAYNAGDACYHLGVQVKANDTVPANTAFAWGTTGATWQPIIDPGLVFQGIHNNALAYSAGSVVALADTNPSLYEALALVPPTTSFTDRYYWRPYASGVPVQNIAEYSRVPMLGANGASPGLAGEVPAPAATDNVNFLRGDGTWQFIDTGLRAWSLADAYEAGDTRTHLGQLVVANGAITANTAFAWGTSGATWKPVLPDTLTYRGNYNVAVTYSADDAVTSSDASPLIYVAAIATTGDSLSNVTFWSPYAAALDIASVVALSNKPLVGADGTDPGVAGDVPVPAATDNTKFLRGDATWAQPAAMVGATVAVDGEQGEAPKPVAGDHAKFLRGDGTWSLLTPMVGATAALDGADGVVTQPLAGDETLFLRGDATWAQPAAMVGATAGLNGAQGEVPAPVSAERTLFLRGDATWAQPAAMVGATALFNGMQGEVPAPTISDEEKFLRGDGTWAKVTSVRDFDASEAFLSGDMREAFGIRVVANANIPAGTPFEWGTTGTTWRPYMPAPALFKGVYSPTTTYASGDIVATNVNSPTIYECTVPLIGSALSDPEHWRPWYYDVYVEGVSVYARRLMHGATAVVNGLEGIVPQPMAGDQNKYLRGDGTWAFFAGSGILLWKLTDEYPSGQTVLYDGNVYIANANIPANTPFTIGTTGTTFSLWLTLETFQGQHDIATSYFASDVVYWAFDSAFYECTASTVGTVPEDTAFWRKYVPGVPRKLTNPFTPATAILDGDVGLVPIPSAGDNARYLRGDGTWGLPTASREWNQVQAYLTGDTAEWLGVVVVANGPVPANTAFAWGLYGSGTATWRPLTQYAPTAFKGLHSPLTAYSTGDILAEGSTNSNLWICHTPTSGSPLSNFNYWEPYKYGTNLTQTIQAARRIMTGATAGVAGLTGSAPTPAAGDHLKFLRGDASWAVPTPTVKGDVLSVTSNGQTSFTLTSSPNPATISAALLYVNGLAYPSLGGTRWSVTGSTLTWTGPHDLYTNDTVTFQYPY